MNNPLSFSSVKLDLFSREGKRLKSASGFVVEAGRQYYLITNWHILTGRDSTREQPEPVMEPFTLKTSIHIYSGEGQISEPLFMGIRKKVTIQLYDEDGIPNWAQLRTNEQEEPVMDVAALLIQVNLLLFGGMVPGTNQNLNSWTKISAISLSAIDTDVEYGPPDTVHIIGHPLGWAPNGTDKSSTAFWRTGSIASEIYETGMSRRAYTFFIDPCAPEGMAGSPVVGMKNGQLKLLGVYSDSSTAEFGANAGLVWDAWLVKELIAAS